MENEVVEQAPPEMPMRTITERDVNTSGPGPYYVYLPGFTIHDLARMTHDFGSIPAGQVFPIDNTRSWTQLNQLPEGAARRTREIKNFWGVTTDRHGALDIPAQTTLDTLLADRVLTSHLLTPVKSFDTIDIHVTALNQMIQPVSIPERTFPAEFRSILETPGVGMLGLRRQWLQEAAEKLETGRVLEDHRRVIEAHPFLKQLWHDAIVGVLIPVVDAFQEYANSILAQKEESVRDGQKKGYDTYDNTLMWLLGRKPERTALSRALEPGKGGGIGIEEIRTLVQEVVGATNGAAAVVAERIQCPDCGEFVNTIGGGPPRKCRHCHYEFRAADQPIEAETASANGSAEPDEVAELEKKIRAGRKN